MTAITFVMLIQLYAAGEATACDSCSCQRSDGASDHEEDTCGPSHHHPHSHGHDHGHAHHGESDGAPGAAGAFSLYSTSSVSANGVAPTVKFAVIGDTQNGESGGHANLLTRLMESVNTHNVDYVLFPGDLIGDTGVSGWNAWKNRTSILGTNSLGRDKRLMTPGNHDRGSGGTFANWQSTFNWLPDSQVVNGLQGIDQVDYYLDHENVRFVSISSDAPGQTYNSRHVNHGPPALDWMREVMKDVDARNGDADPDNDIQHVFTFSHRPVTTQFESPTGGTNGAWWQSMTGQDAQSGNHAATAFLAGHWHIYQPSRPDPDVDTMEIISGTGGGGLEGQQHRNRHGYSIITIDGGDVTSEFYGDENQGSDSWNFELLDSYSVAQTGGLPRGELAFYGFPARLPVADTSSSPLSKAHALNFRGSAQAVADAEQGDVLRTLGDGNSYVDAQNIGDNNLAVLGDLTISLSAKVNQLAAGTPSTLVAFGGAHGSGNGSLNAQESANHAYKFSITEGGRLQLAWQHDDADWQTITSNAPTPDPSEWRQYEVQRDAETMAVGFFVDGQPIGDVLGADFLPTGGGSASLYIGSGVGGVEGFDGWIDDVRIDSSDVSLAPVLVGDFSGDGVIDGIDWTIFAAGIGSDTPGPTDLDGDGTNGYPDFLAFRQLYEEFNGAGSFAALVARVPEPSSIVLLVLGWSCLLRVGRIEPTTD